MSPDAARVAELYDRKAGEYDGHYLRNSDQAEDHVLYGWLKPFTDKRMVLDVGCGTGLAIEYLSPWSYTGVDLSARMLERAYDRIERIRERRRRYRLAFPTDWCALSEHHFFHQYEGSFDAAICLWAFPHFPDQQQALNLMARSVSPGGHVIVQGFAQRYARRPNYILNGHGAELLSPTTPTSLGRMAESAGLVVQEVRGFRYLLDHSALESLPVPLLERAFKASSALVPASMAATHVLIAQRPL